MNRKAPDMNSANMLAWTERARSRVHAWIKLSNDVTLDIRRLERLDRSSCKACFYGVRVGGRSMTDQPCMCCGKDELYSSTDTDVLCIQCAEKHSLCKHCGGDLEMCNKRRDWPVSDKK